MGNPEAVLMGQIARQPQTLNNLETDLALAYFEAEKDRVILVRDGCGLSPLFFAHCSHGWAFAFDLDQLFQLMGTTPPPDEATFYDFVATHYRYVFRDPGRTFHQGVRQVPAGYSVVLDSTGCHEQRWLNIPFIQEISELSPQKASERYVELLDRNVKTRLNTLTGQKLAFTISSGMDSASVAALAARHLGRPLDTWFVAYRDQSHSPYDETEGVEALIKATGWNLNRVDLGAPDLLDQTARLMNLTRAPLITVTWLAHHVMAQKIAQSGANYLFSGLGGDESLAGEFEHFFVFFADLKKSGQIELLDLETKAWIRLHDHPVFKKSPEVRDDWLARNIDFQTGELKVDRRRYEAVREYFDPGWVSQREAAAPPIPMPRPYPYFLSNRLYEEMNYETSPPTLWSEALSSRAAGVKGIFPMTSPALLSLALSAPGTSKYENGITKMLLRRAMKGILPDSSRLNPVKTGFNAPLDLWLREKKLNSDCRDLLESSPFRNLGWLKADSVEKILKEHLEGEKNHMMLLWPLISTALFLNL
jgi:asparagine synthase (glutamine-hydrolysing)